MKINTFIQNTKKTNSANINLWVTFWCLIAWGAYLSLDFLCMETIVISGTTKSKNTRLFLLCAIKSCSLLCQPHLRTLLPRWLKTQAEGFSCCSTLCRVGKAKLMAQRQTPGHTDMGGDTDCHSNAFHSTYTLPSLTAQAQAANSPPPGLAEREAH